MSLTAPNLPEAGSIIAGRYRVDGEIGAGGMGVVLRALDTQTNAPVALKVLLPDGTAMDETTARFDREVRAMSKIASPHVVTVLDAGRTDQGLPFLAMELLEGTDLAQLIAERGRLPREEAVGLILQACAGAAAAHAAGIVHRDLKPANLFLSTRDQASPILKILDFGLTKILSAGVRLTLTSTTLGTPMYMAPEQVASTKNVDARCDQHALAMILYELLTGRPPYDFENPGKLVVAIVTHPVPSPRALLPELPLPLDRTIRRAMAKQPDDRFDDVGQFARALEPYASLGAAQLARTAEATLSAAFGGDAEATSTMQLPRPSAHLSSFETGPTTQLVVAPPAGRAAVLSPPKPGAGKTAPRGHSLGSRLGPQLRLLIVGVSVGVLLMVIVAFVVAGLVGEPPAPSP